MQTFIVSRTWLSASFIVSHGLVTCLTVLSFLVFFSIVNKNTLNYAILPHLGHCQFNIQEIILSTKQRKRNNTAPDQTRQDGSVG